MYRAFGKRLLDLAVTIPALVLLAPVLALVTLLVRLKLGAPVLFRQERAGRHGRPFTLIKFRTMTDARDEQGELLADAERLTPFGRFLRRASLDELPQLVNVLRGEMSLVGPRPLYPAYLAQYTPEQNRRHDVPPGITGLAQVRGRNASLFSERLRHDVEYVDTLSLWLDCRILLRTVYLVGFGKLEDGAGQEVSAVDDIGLNTEPRRPPAGGVRANRE